MAKLVGFLVISGLTVIGTMCCIEKILEWKEDSQRWYDSEANKAS